MGTPLSNLRLLNHLRVENELGHQHECRIHFSALDCGCKVNTWFKFMQSQLPCNDELQPRPMNQINFLSPKQLSHSNKK